MLSLACTLTNYHSNQGPTRRDPLPLCLSTLSHLSTPFLLPLPNHIFKINVSGLAMSWETPFGDCWPAFIFNHSKTLGLSGQKEMQGYFTFKYWSPNPLEKRKIAMQTSNYGKPYKNEINSQLFTWTNTQVYHSLVAMCWSYIKLCSVMHAQLACYMYLAHHMAGSCCSNY